MRILVNDIAASAGGARSILESFYAYVRKCGGDHEWIFLLGSDLLDESVNIRTIPLPKVKKSWWRRLAFDFVTGRRLIKAIEPDVVFSLQNTYTYGISCPQVIYVHQPLPFQRAKNFSLWRPAERTLAIYQHVIGAVIRRSIRRANHVIVQTEWMRDAIAKQVRIHEDSISNILPDPEDLSAYRQDEGHVPSSFVYPTAANLYKNNECVYRACELLRQQTESPFTVTLTMSGASPDPNVDFIGRVPRERVLDLLSRSTLIFPSRIETYGLPLAEARALGAIVLAADLPYAREVLRGYNSSYFFDPDSPEQLALLMGKVLDGSIVRTPGAHDGIAGPEIPATPAWADVLSVIERAAQAGGAE